MKTTRRTFVGLGAAALGSLYLGDLPRAEAATGDDWPQWRGPGRDGVWKEQGLVDKLAGPDLPIKWRAPIAGGYSGPTVAGGRVYVTDLVGEGPRQERVHCFDAETVKPVWTHAYEVNYGGLGYQAGPRASVSIHDGRAYALGAVGHFHCFDAARGTMLWTKDLNQLYQINMPTWGTAASPLIDGDLAIVQCGGTNGACVVALDRKTGQERWKAANDRASYSAPILINQAGKRVLVVYTGDRVLGMNPQSGALYWEHPFPARQVVIGIATPVVEKDRLFITNFYEGALMLRLHQDKPGVEKLWERRGPNERTTDAIQSIIATPIMVDGYVYGVDSYGELRCLDAKTGDRVWEDQTAVPRARWSTIHLTPNADRVWMFNERGQLLITKLSPKGFQEISRAQLIKPTTRQLPQRGGVCWAHPAYAYRHVFARNDEELVCASLAP